MQTGIDGKLDGKKIAIFTGVCLLIAYLVTGLLLLLLAFLAYKANLSEQGTRIGIFVIYIVSSFVAGFITGKKSKKRKFLFGALMGICYFLVLLALSIGIHDKAAPGASSKWIGALLCMGGGMLGGMLS